MRVNLKPKRWLPAGILILAVSVAFLLVKTRPQAEPVSVEEKAWLVSVQQVEPQPRQPTLTLYGRVESLWSTRLTAALQADVAAIEVIEGDQVAEGDLLLTLDERDARLLLAQREAELREAEARITAQGIRHQADLQALPLEKRLLDLNQAEVARARELIRKELGARSNLDQALQGVQRQALQVTAREQAIREHESKLAELEAKRAKVQALHDQAQLELERTRVRAPFNASIARVLVSPGQRVRPGDALVEVYDTDAMVLRAQIPLRYLAEVRESLAANQEITVQGEIDGRPVQATLLRLAGEVSRDSGGLEALFRIEGLAQDLLRQGRFVRLDLLLPAEPDLVALPHEAVYGVDRIYRAVDGRMQALRIERVGETRDAQGAALVLVRSDQLSAGDEVIITQLPNAVEGLRVRTVKTDG